MKGCLSFRPQNLYKQCGKKNSQQRDDSQRHSKLVVIFPRSFLAHENHASNAYHCPLPTHTHTKNTENRVEDSTVGEENNWEWNACKTRSPNHEWEIQGVRRPAPPRRPPWAPARHFHIPSPVNFKYKYNSNWYQKVFFEKKSIRRNAETAFSFYKVFILITYSR